LITPAQKIEKNAAENFKRVLRCKRRTAFKQNVISMFSQWTKLLKKLEKFDPEQARLVELRFFGGLTIEETAQVLSVSPSTVKREWQTAKLWLLRELK
jgi:DNA-directed RNA polymerase specialized sigma24 family protein